MARFDDKQIIASWEKNVAPWVQAVRRGEIRSRVQVTDSAIVEAVLHRNPGTILDLGCGEGWLCRALGRHGVETLGIDVVPDLIAAAEKAGTGRFMTMAYEAVSPDSIPDRFDAVICNFSLLGEASVEHLFQQIPGLLTAGGALIVQTLHPESACAEAEYRDGWRAGSWAGFGDAFVEPAPWYFRTLESWKALFGANGLRLVDTVEPINPDTGGYASVIFVGEVSR